MQLYNTYIPSTNVDGSKCVGFGCVGSSQVRAANLVEYSSCKKPRMTA